MKAAYLLPQHRKCMVHTRYIHGIYIKATKRARLHVHSHTPPTCMAQAQHMHRHNHMHRHGPYTSHPRHIHGTCTVHAPYTPTTSHAQHIHQICILASSRAPSIHDGTFIRTVHAEHAPCVRGTHMVHVRHACSYV